MGYSSRYHVASLAAVFLALAVGILIGAAFGADLLEDVGRDLERSLQSDLEDANAEIASVEAELERQQQFAETVYPALVTGTLSGRSIALVAFGDRPEAIRENVLDALAPTGATLSQLAVVREPPDVDALSSLLAGRARGAERKRRRASEAARRAGAALVNGQPFYDVARETLLSSFSGGPAPVDGVIVARQRPELDASGERASERLEIGLIEGLTVEGTPVVGVERTDADASSIEFFDSLGLTTVDDIDLVAGRVALAYALRGAQGSFGVGEDADELVPPLLRRPGSPPFR